MYPSRGDKPGAHSLMACNPMYIQGEAALVPLPRREAALPAGQGAPAQRVPQHPNQHDAREVRGSRMHPVTPSCNHLSSTSSKWGCTLYVRSQEKRKKLLPNGKLTMKELERVRQVVHQACHRM